MMRKGAQMFNYVVMVILVMVIMIVIGTLIISYSQQSLGILGGLLPVGQLLPVAVLHGGDSEW